MAKGMLADVPQLHDAVALISEFLNSVEYLMTIMQPDARKYLDQYCTGLMFGN